MSYATACAAKNSLVLVDEFGRGTDAADGLALLAAFLKTFLRRNECCPHVIVTTHYHQLTSILKESELVEHLVSTVNKSLSLIK